MLGEWAKPIPCGVCRGTAPPCFGTPSAVATQLPLTLTTSCFGTPPAVATQLCSHNTVFWDTLSCPTQLHSLSHNTVFWDTLSCRNAAPLTLTQHRVLGHPQLSNAAPLTHTTPCFGTPSAVQRSSTHSHNTVFWDTTSCRNAAPLTQHRVLGHPQLSNAAPLTHTVLTRPAGCSETQRGRVQGHPQLSQRQRHPPTIDSLSLSLSQGRHAAVVRDCTAAVARVDSAKPRLRRALALEALEQYDSEHLPSLPLTYKSNAELVYPRSLPA
jgi:hypothetical protein